jgi:hypothetical protein
MFEITARTNANHQTAAALTLYADGASLALAVAASTRAC